MFTHAVVNLCTTSQALIKRLEDWSKKQVDSDTSAEEVKLVRVSPSFRFLSLFKPCVDPCLQISSLSKGQNSLR